MTLFRAFQAMINAMKKEVFEAGHIHPERGTRRVMQEGADSEGCSLSAFMHATTRDKFLPLLVANCKAMTAQVRYRNCRLVDGLWHNRVVL